MRHSCEEEEEEEEEEGLTDRITGTGKSCTLAAIARGGGGGSDVLIAARAQLVRFA